MAERVRKIGSTTLRSIGQIAKLQTVIEDNDAEFVPPADMLRELMNDSRRWPRRSATPIRLLTSTRMPRPRA